MSKFMTIYDYDDKQVQVEIPDKEIVEIFVHVISGDETGWIEFVDGTRIHFDASNCRMIGYDDGCYCVKGKDIEKWLNFEPNKEDLFCFSYDRQGIFD